MPSNISKNSRISPKVSIIIPTLNAAKVLVNCLKSIKLQKYNNYEILICDGGSIDDTLKIARNYGCQIIKNNLKTSESGKAVGLKYATGKYVAFIDSDNILPNSKWLNQMISPLEKDPQLIGSEPWEFTYRKNAGFIERYSALIGANDPYAYITGIYDRRSVLNPSWNNLKLNQKNFSSYLKVKLEPNKPLPTIGANGTVFRSNFIKSKNNSRYLFDIDVITQRLKSLNTPLYFAKTKNGIIHTYCESTITKFYRKQMRRLKDYYQFKNQRHFNYRNDLNQNPVHNLWILIRNNLKFVLYTLLIIPTLITTIKGFINKPDFAWFFHPIACFITLYCYVYVSISYLFGFKITQSRKTWSQ